VAAAAAAAAAEEEEEEEEEEAEPAEAAARPATVADGGGHSGFREGSAQQQGAPVCLPAGLGMRLRPTMELQVPCWPLT